MKKNFDLRQMKTLLFKEDIEYEQLPELASKICQELSDKEKFVLWLEGEVGAGKTTLTGLILHNLGLPASQPVGSPTYTYLNDYKIGTHWYAHMDLYRVGSDFSPEDLGLLDERSYTGLFVEWPGNIHAISGLEPTHCLSISYPRDVNDLTYRTYSLQTF